MSRTAAAARPRDGGGAAEAAAASSSAAGSSAAAAAGSVAGAVSALEVLSAPVEPPPWRPRLHPGSAAAGIPDYYPSQPNNDEENEGYIRHGITPRPAVGNETMTAHDMIYDRIRGAGVLDLLGSLFSEVLLRREELQRERIAAPTHRPPPRVTLNEVKLAAYIKDLADPDVPLQRLARSVPHGYRGERMLDMLWSGSAAPPAAIGASAASAVAASRAATPREPVEVHRAVWFIRVVGATEITSSRSRQNSNYTGEWTNVFAGWMRKQLSELNVGTPGGNAPSSPTVATARAGLTARTASALAAATSGSSTPRDSVVLQTPDLERKWTAKWAYSLSLARALAAQSLLDLRVLARWAFELIGSASLPQLPFVVSLAQEHVHLCPSSYALAHALIEGAAARIAELERVRSGPVAARMAEQLGALLRYAFDSAPETFVAPALWAKHGAVLRRVLSAGAGAAESSAHAAQREADLEHLEARNKQALLSDEAARTRTGSREGGDIELLDNFSASSDLEALCAAYFAHDSGGRPLSAKLDTLLIWATTSWRSGLHRPWLAAQLIQMLFDDDYETSHGSTTSERPSKRSRSNGASFDLDLFLFRWLSSVDATQSNAPQNGAALHSHQDSLASVELTNVIITFGELIRHGCFSFAKYLQRLTARGMTATSSHSNGERSNESNGATQPAHENSLHTRLLRSLPVHRMSTPLAHQRRAAIYGMRPTESHEEAAERRAVRELHASMPWLFAAPGTSGPVSDIEPAVATALIEQVPHLWSASRFTRIRVIGSRILPAVKQLGEALTADRYVVLARFMSEARDFVSLSDLVTSLLRSLFTRNDAALAAALFSTITEHSAIWASLRSLPALVDAVNSVHSVALAADRESVAEACRISCRSLAALGVAGIASNSAQPSIADGGPDTGASASTPEVDSIILDALRPASTDSASTAIFDRLRACGLSPPALGRAVMQSALSALASETSEEPLADVLNLVRVVQQLGRASHVALGPALRDWTFAHVNDAATPPEAARGGLAAFLLHTVSLGWMDVGELLNGFVVPCVAETARASADSAAEPTFPALLQTCLLVARTLLLTREHGSSLTLSLQVLHHLGARRTELLESQSVMLVYQLVAYLAVMPSDTSKAPAGVQAASGLCDDLLASPKFQTATCSRHRLLAGAIREVGKSAWGVDVPSAFERIFGTLDPNGLIRVAPLELDCAVVVDHLDPWRSLQAVVELTFIIERLQTVEASSQARAQAKLSSLAACVFEPFFLGEHAELGLELLRETKNLDFMARIVDIGMRELLERLTSDWTSDAPNEAERRAEALLGALAAVAICGERPALVCGSTDSTNRLVFHIADWLETLVQRSHASAHDLVGADLRGLALRLKVLHLLLRVSNLWTPANKAVAPRLIGSLLQLAIAHGAAGEDEALFAALLDACISVLDELPSDANTQALAALGAACPPNSLLFDARGHQLPAHNTVRLARLLPLPALSAPGAAAGSLVLARSAHSALTLGSWTAAVDRPWELHDHVDPSSIPGATNGAAASALPTGGARPAASAAVQSELGYAATPLTNAGALPLGLFAAHKTRDRVPSSLYAISAQVRHEGSSNSVASTPRAAVEEPRASAADEARLGWAAYESERTYGDGVGGEPAAARDARRAIDLLPHLIYADDGEAAASKAAALPPELRRADEILRQQELDKERIRAEADEARERQARKRKEPPQDEAAPGGDVHMSSMKSSPKTVKARQKAGAAARRK